MYVWALKYAKWWEECKSGLIIQIGQYFTLFLAKKGQICLSGILTFWDCFWQKKVKCYPIWILRPDVKSSIISHILGPNLMIYAFRFFDFPCIFKNFKLFSTPLKVLKIGIFRCTIEFSMLKSMANHSTCFQFTKLIFSAQPSARLCSFKKSS